MNNKCNGIGVNKGCCDTSGACVGAGSACPGAGGTCQGGVCCGAKTEPCCSTNPKCGAGLSCNGQGICQ
jgi:hypothetical protein